MSEPGRGWQAGDTAIYCGTVDGLHVYMSPEAAKNAGIEGRAVEVVDG